MTETEQREVERGHAEMRHTIEVWKASRVKAQREREQLTNQVANLKKSLKEAEEAAKVWRYQCENANVAGLTASLDAAQKDSARARQVSRWHLSHRNRAVSLMRRAVMLFGEGQWAGNCDEVRCLLEQMTAFVEFNATYGAGEETGR